MKQSFVLRIVKRTGDHLHMFNLSKPFLLGRHHEFAEKRVDWDAANTFA
jgi:hypothetical protein